MNLRDLLAAAAVLAGSVTAGSAAAEQWYVANLRPATADTPFAALYAVDLDSITAEGDMRSARAVAAVDGGSSPDQYTVNLEQYDCARGLTRLAEVADWGPEGMIGRPLTLSLQQSRWRSADQPHTAAAVRAVCDPASRTADRVHAGDRAALLAWFHRQG